MTEALSTAWFGIALISAAFFALGVCVGLMLSVLLDAGVRR